MDIVIVGAGLGGLTAAALRLQRGHRVPVLERSSGLGERGAGIELSAHAIKVLDRIGLRPALEPVAVRTKALEFGRFDSGEMLHRLPLGELHEQRHGAPSFQPHRADLHGALQQAVRAPDPSTLSLGACVTGLLEGAAGVLVQLDGAPTLRSVLVRAPTASSRSCAARCRATTAPASPVRWHGAAPYPPSASRPGCAPTSSPPCGAGRSTTP